MNLSNVTVASLYFVVVYGVAAADSFPSEDENQVSMYSDRPLQLPQLDVDDGCPVSVGVTNVVSSEHQYVFGAGGYFFGTGPVYLALSWKPWNRAEAYFDLSQRTFTPDGYRLKTPWIMHPDYEGEALVRGARIGADTKGEVRFAESTQSQAITSNMVLRSDVTGTLVSDSQKSAVHAVWGFWPSHVILSEPGCYAVQIDTKDKSDIVVFEAKGTQ